MKKYALLILIFLSCFYSSQLKQEENDSISNNNLYFAINKNLDLSKQHILIANNYFNKNNNYFSPDIAFQSNGEKLRKDIQKPFAVSIIENVISGILNNKKNNK